MRNAPATVVNWTSGRTGITIGESQSQGWKKTEIERGYMRTGKSRRIFCAVLMVVTALLVAAAAHAQQATGAITGAVTDPSGAPVAGATITVTDADRGTSLKTQTNTDGLYNFPQLPIGNISAARGGQRIPDVCARRRECWP